MEVASVVVTLSDWLPVLILGPLTAGALGLGLRTYAQYRGKRLLSCPRDGRPAGLEVDARHAAVTGSLGWPELRVARCSRWPTAPGCNEACLQQIEAAPKESLVQTIVSRWHRQLGAGQAGSAPRSG
jgi:hypothetical protein